MVLTLVGIVFVVVGLLGFVNDPVLGIFEVDATHNTLHIVSGILALMAVGLGFKAMRFYARVFGGIYGLIGMAGFVFPETKVLGLFEANLADDLLHLALGAVFLYVGYVMQEDDALLSPEAASLESPSSPDEAGGIQ